MVAKKITDLRIFPPLVTARFGSAKLRDEASGTEYADAMDNYDIESDGTSNWNELIPAETLELGPARDGEGRIVWKIRGSHVPTNVQFRGNEDRIRPISPFLELWGRVDDREDLQPITRNHVDPARVTWNIDAANRKAQRRTRQNGDVVRGKVSVSGHHRMVELTGEASNFLPGRAISLGQIVYPEPTEDFPEIRMRIYPANGQVFGHKIEDRVTADRVIYDTSKGTWQNYLGEQDPFATVPGGLEVPGFFDDSCDGLVFASIEGFGGVPGRARFACGPPDYVPAAQHLRTGGDDLEQAFLPPLPNDLAILSCDERNAFVCKSIDIVRRAVETMRSVNPGSVNERNAFHSSRISYNRLVAFHASLVDRVAGLKSSDPERFRLAQGELEKIGDALREVTETFELDPETYRKMPAMMRGGYGGRMTLTTRQMEHIRRAKALR